MISFTEAELTNPEMPDEERLSRMIPRALGHNDDGGMYWERYELAARLILREYSMPRHGMDAQRLSAA